jgi:broad specificity phosphatase PhoE/predicted kinase
MFPLARPLALVMVGLPARGKTYLARKLARWLGWQGYRAEVFNVGSYRRARVGADQPAAFFDPDNPEGRQAREEVARAALDDLIAWVSGGGGVAIYDATNSTRTRRRAVASRLAREGLDVVFVESICNDPAILSNNIRETKVSSPDYVGQDPKKAIADFRARIAHYERAYEPVQEDEGSFVKLIDVGTTVITHRVRGYLAGQIASWLGNLHTDLRPIWLTRHGESEANPENRIGGDPDLTASGQAYAARLTGFLRSRVDPAPVVWTSTLRRAGQTAAALPWPAVRLKLLDEIDAGIFDGWTYAEVGRRAPDEAAARAADKLRYRYPRGESYLDVIGRLLPVIAEIERQRAPVVVVAHNAIIRVLYGFFAGKQQDDVPRLEIPLHTLIRLLPKAYGADEERIFLGP